MPVVATPVAMVLAQADAGSGEQTVAIVIAAAGLVLAAASLVVSWAALHATALKRATISMHQAEAMWSWHVAGWSALVPTGEHVVAIAVYAHNGGANAGILESVDVQSDATLDGLLARPVSWYPAKTSLDTHPSNFRIELPKGIDAGEIEELFLVGRMQLAIGPTERLVPDEAADRKQEDAFARQLHEATSMPVKITWRYARPAGLLGGGDPDKKDGALHSELPITELRDRCVRHWETEAAREQQSAYTERARRLAAIATTGEPPDPSENK